MKRIFLTLMVLVFLGLMLNTAAAEQDLLQSVANGCKMEMDT